MAAESHRVVLIQFHFSSKSHLKWIWISPRRVIHLFMGLCTYKNMLKLQQKQITRLNNVPLMICGGGIDTAGCVNVPRSKTYICQPSVFPIHK